MDARRSWSLRPEDRRRLDSLLSKLLAGSGVRCATILNREGQVLAWAGDTAGVDIVSFASLAAADFTASAQLSGILGDTEAVSLYHEGESGSLYLLDLGGFAILAAMFDNRTSLGLVRLVGRVLQPRFVAALEEVRSRAWSALPFQEAWLEEAAGEIDRLFAD